MKGKGGKSMFTTDYSLYFLALLAGFAIILLPVGGTIFSEIGPLFAIIGIVVVIVFAVVIIARALQVLFNRRR